MSTIPLAQVIIEGNLASRPTAGSAGRLFFASDTKQHFYDNGASWDVITTQPASVTIAPGAAGPYTKPHGLAFTPSAVVLVPTSGAAMWLQTPTGFDATNIYVEASDPSATCIAVCHP